MSCKPLTPNSENASLAGISAAIRAAASLREHRRLLAFKTMMPGAVPDFAAELYNVTGRTLRNWTGAFNAQGLDGLLDDVSAGILARFQSERTAVADPGRVVLRLRGQGSRGVGGAS